MTGRYSFMSYYVSRGNRSHFSSSQHYSIQLACLLSSFIVYLVIVWCSKSHRCICIFATTMSIFYTFYGSCFEGKLFIVLDAALTLVLAVLFPFLLVTCLSRLISFALAFFCLLLFCFCACNFCYYYYYCFYSCCCCCCCCCTFFEASICTVAFDFSVFVVLPLYWLHCQVLLIILLSFDWPALLVFTVELLVNVTSQGIPNVYVNYGQAVTRWTIYTTLRYLSSHKCRNDVMLITYCQLHNCKDISSGIYAFTFYLFDTSWRFGVWLTNRRAEDLCGVEVFASLPKTLREVLFIW